MAHSNSALPQILAPLFPTSIPSSTSDLCWPLAGLLGLGGRTFFRLPFLSQKRTDKSKTKVFLLQKYLGSRQHAVSQNISFLIFVLVSVFFPPSEQGTCYRDCKRGVILDPKGRVSRWQRTLFSLKFPSQFSHLSPELRTTEVAKRSQGAFI